MIQMKSSTDAFEGVVQSAESHLLATEKSAGELSRRLTSLDEQIQGKTGVKIVET
jgi:hypothetical protein